jgi:mRNA interferase MazF
MQTAISQRIEADIRQLPLADQLWLLERLVQHIREQAIMEPPDRHMMLAAMAEDPQIQRELQLISADFAGTERDGLGDGRVSIHRGDVHFVDLNPVQGREQAGQRPVLVLSIDAINSLPLVVTVVVGTNGANLTRDYPTNVRVSSEDSGLPLETVFLCFQLRSLDASQFPAWDGPFESRKIRRNITTRGTPQEEVRRMSG